MTDNSPNSSPKVKKKVMPEPSPTALALQNTDAEQLVGNLPLEVAQQIVAEWRAAREDPDLPKARESSITQYLNNARTLEARYSREAGVDFQTLSPIEILKRFFEHARTLKTQTWHLYRYSFLYTMNNRAIEFDKKGYPQETLIIALAALIVVSRQPYQDYKIPAPARKLPGESRPKSIKSQYFTKLIDHLQESHTRNHNAKRAQSFAIATIATGLRPGEWLHAEVREATREDVPVGKLPEGLLAVIVKTAKRKQGEATWVRTLLVESVIHQNHIHQHIKFFREAVSMSNDPEYECKRYIRKCSLTLSHACRTLWPTKPERWITLYTLRSQARANFTAVNGKFVAAAMLGHSPKKSSEYYAGVHRANLTRGPQMNVTGVPVPYPGANVLLKANDFIAQAEAQSKLRASRADQAAVPDMAESDAA